MLVAVYLCLCRLLPATNTSPSVPLFLGGFMSEDCYGNQRTRHRAKATLTAQELLAAHGIVASTWLVIGGELAHGVTISNGTYHCDCNGYEGATDGMCSHCLAVWLAIHGDFKKRGRR